MASSHEFHLDVNAGLDRSTAVPLDDTPFRIAILGDFSGRGSRRAVEGGAALARRPAWPVDRDDLDVTLRELGPVLELPLEGDGPPLTIRVRALDDFHPDHLWEKLPLFQALRELRGKLANPATFKAAAAELTGAAPPPPPRRPTGGSLLGDILDAQSPTDVEEVLADAEGDLHGFIQRIMKPHLVPNPDPRQGEMLAQVDAAASATLRSILHHPAFQALEALWRGIDTVVRQLDTGPDLKVLLLDVSEAEVAAALPSGGDPGKSPLFALLARDRETAPWGLIIAASTFGPSLDDIERVAQLAAIGMTLRAPVIAAADPALAGVGAEFNEVSSWTSPPPAWVALRATSFARSLGLVLPGFLGRVPYGAGLEECERIRFEEFEGGRVPDRLLLGNPALMVAVVLGRGFTESRWSLMGSLEPIVSGLPVGSIGRGPGAVAVGPGAFPVAVRAAEALMERGFMVLAPVKDTDQVRLVRVQSCATPLGGLAGRWG